MKISHKKAVFLDRDGVLNMLPEIGSYITKPYDFIWNKNAIELIRIIKNSGYLSVIISNQRGVALGKMSIEDLRRINEKIDIDLKAYGLCIDRKYYCIHNIEENCECRKPKPGMIFSASKDMGIDLSSSLFIGDSENDIQAANSAGVKIIKVDSNNIDLEKINYLLVATT